MLIAFHKPYGVVTQFTVGDFQRPTLAGFGLPAEVYPLGRLDADSEGLLLLTDEPALNERLLHPRHAHVREYWVQVERIPSADNLAVLARGIVIEGQPTRPCRVWRLDPDPAVPERFPPVRFRKTVPTCWIAMELIEGRNRQVRRMTAAVGHPTLRLFRARIGQFALGALPPGQWMELGSADRERVIAR